MLKTRVKKTKKQVEYHIKLAEHTPDPNALDIYAGNLSKVMKNFQNIGDFIDSENAFAPEQREKLKDNLNSVMAMLNGTIHFFFESNGIDTIGYDGAQVPKQPRRKKYNQAVIWPRDETWE